MNNKKYIAISVLLAGIIVSFSAGIYSIIGLSKLFSGAAIAVMIMATSLEISKIIITSTLKIYWKEISLKLKIYLIPATIILMVITSMGIYGFLTSAYQEVYVKNDIYETKMKAIEDKKKNYQDNIDLYKIEKENLFENIKDLSKNLTVSNQTVDKKTGQLIIKSNNQAQQRVDNQLNKYNEKLTLLDQNIKINNDSINKLLQDKTFLNENSESVSELGPLKYISKLTSTDIDIVVNYLILIIIFVFDPLAIAMLLLGLELLKSKHKPKEKEIKEDIIQEVIKTEPEGKIEEVELPIETEVVKEEEIIDEPEESEINKLIDETFNLTPEKRKNLPHELTRKIELKNINKNLDNSI